MIWRVTFLSFFSPSLALIRKKKEKRKRKKSFFSCYISIAKSLMNSCNFTIFTHILLRGKNPSLRLPWFFPQTFQHVDPLGVFCARFNRQIVGLVAKGLTWKQYSMPLTVLSKCPWLNQCTLTVLRPCPTSLMLVQWPTMTLRPPSS